jgi:tRNA (guanine-N(7)-)-methyltransferase
MGNRVRRHTDPLQCRVAVRTEDWLGAYRSRGEGDIWLDLGCGKGELLAELAQTRPEVFFIGIEVRIAIARRFFPVYSHIPNLVLLHGNVNLSVPSMMGGRKVQRVLINFPDPFDHKARYRKRQMVNQELVDGICEMLAPGGVVSVKSDRDSLFQDMDAMFQRRMELLVEDAPSCGLLALSEWESDCLKKSLPVFSRDYKIRRM